MVLIDIDINVFNVLKFIVVELLVACVLQPAREFIISRTTHARIVRGERVTLAPLPKSRTFPCVLSAGRLSRFVAFTLSLSAHSLRIFGFGILCRLCFGDAGKQ